MGLAVADQVNDPSPLPLPVTVNQDWLLEDVQDCTQPTGVPVTVMVRFHPLTESSLVYSATATCMWVTLRPLE